MLPAEMLGTHTLLQKKNKKINVNVSFHSTNVPRLNFASDLTLKDARKKKSTWIGFKWGGSIMVCVVLFPFMEQQHQVM